ncbi:MAG: hypothetical protein HRU28_05050 [Rhizobiales bacterium]|nr:hypothetical protein [Hyphomicrobiales bacterium]
MSYELCGHCGTEVFKEFNICRGCGAHRRARPGLFLYGILIFVLALVPLGFGYDYGHLNLISIGVIMLIISVFVMRSSLKKRWCRNTDVPKKSKSLFEQSGPWWD